MGARRHEIWPHNFWVGSCGKGRESSCVAAPAPVDGPWRWADLRPTWGRTLYSWSHQRLQQVICLSFEVSVPEGVLEDTLVLRQENTAARGNQIPGTWREHIIGARQALYVFSFLSAMKFQGESTLAVFTFLFKRDNPDHLFLFTCPHSPVMNLIHQQ